MKQRFVKNNISGCEQQQGCSIISGDSSCRTLEATGSVGGGGESGIGGVQSTGQTQSSIHTTPAVQQPQQPSSISTCLASCCAESAKKVNYISNLKLKSRIINETECRLNKITKGRHSKYCINIIYYQ